MREKHFHKLLESTSSNIQFRKEKKDLKTEQEVIKNNIH